MATTRTRRTDWTVLYRVPYETYVQLCEEPANFHLRMTFYDGTLEIMAPRFIHEQPSSRIGMLIRAVTCELEIPCTGAGSTTFKRRGKVFDPAEANAKLKGKGKEPDESFYITNEAFLRGKTKLDLDAGDLPPDLWIEVDNRSSSRGRLPLYAELGVPEVWRFRVRSGRLWLGRLIEGSSYEAIDRSLALPMLTPAVVLEALAMCEGLSESAWDRRLRDWVRETLRPPGGVENGA